MDIATRFQPQVRANYLHPETADVPDEESTEVESQTRRKFQRTDVSSKNPDAQFRKPTLPASAIRQASLQQQRLQSQQQQQQQQQQGEGKSAQAHNRRRSTMRESMRVPSGPRELPAGSPGKRIPSIGSTPTASAATSLFGSINNSNPNIRSFLPHPASEPFFSSAKPGERQQQPYQQQAAPQQQQLPRKQSGSNFAFRANRNPSRDDITLASDTSRTSSGLPPLVDGNGSGSGFDFLPAVNFDDLHTRLRDYDGPSSLTEFPAVGGGRGWAKDIHQQYGVNGGMAARGTGLVGSTGVRVASGKQEEGQERKPMTRSESFRKRIGSGSSSIAKVPEKGSRDPAPMPTTQPALSLRTRRQSTLPSSAALPTTSIPSSGRTPRKSVGSGLLTNMMDSRKASQQTPVDPVETSKPVLSRTSSLNRARRTTVQPAIPSSVELPRLSAVTATTQSRAAKVKSLQPPPRDGSDPNTPNGRLATKNNVNRAHTPSSSGNKRQSMASGRASGLGARTISPTDARRLKRMSMMQPPPMPTKGPPTPQQEEMPTSTPTARLTDPVPRLAQPSPSLIPRKASTTFTPTSANASPEGRLGVAALPNPSLSTKPSFVSLQHNNNSSSSLTNGSSSRLPTPKGRNVHSSSAQYGEDDEIIPPVPAIPKSYESPNEREVPFFSTMNKSSLSIPREPTFADLDADNSPVPGVPPSGNIPGTTTPQSPRGSGHGHKRTMTVGSTTGTSSTMAGSKARPLPDPAGRRNNNLQPLRLPPLSLLPLGESLSFSRSTNDLEPEKYEAEEHVTVKTPEPRRTAKTPSTPMTASKATFFRRKPVDDKSKQTRSSSSHHTSRELAGKDDGVATTRFWDDSEEDQPIGESAESVGLNGTSQGQQTQQSQGRSAITPFASGSLPKGSGEFARLRSRPSGEYTDDSDAFSLGTFDHLRLQNSRPLGPRPRTSGTVNSWKATAETPLSEETTPVTEQPPSAPAVLEKQSPEKEKKESAAVGLRRKLSLGWRRSSSKAANHAENSGKSTSTAEDGGKGVSKRNEMPPPKLPASATWTGEMGVPPLPSSARPSLDSIKRKSNASSAFAAAATANLFDSGSTPIADAGPKTRALHSEQPQPVSNGTRSSSWGSFNISGRNTTATSANKPTHAPSLAPNGLPRPLPPGSRSNHNASISSISAIVKDKDDAAADDEMRRLSQKRRDVDAMAREAEELKRRAVPRSPLTPEQALHDRGAGLNIFERGEVTEYSEKGIFFTGTKNAKKIIGSLSPADGVAGGSDGKGGSGNFGYDDERGDYNIVFGDHLAYRYEVVDLLGKGSFGQVVRCVDHKEGGVVAIKIIRNKKRFHQQALVEVGILEKLRDWDPDSTHATLSITASFYFRSHLCIVTPCLGMNLYEFIRAHNFSGFSLPLIRRFSRQLLACLVLLQRKRIIHCDLKPENILLCSARQADVRVIDFGSSCREEEKVYTYIQSRFYRSPEVILGSSYGLGIDMWSFGCILAELWTGYPLFPGENEQEQLACIMEIFGAPDRHLVERCTRKKLFFDSVGKPRVTVSSKGRRRRPSSKTLSQALKTDDEAFIDFIARCLRWDPDRRLKPSEACAHPFIRNMPLQAAKMAQGIPDEARRAARVRSSAAIPAASSALGSGSSSPIKRGNAFAQQQSQAQQPSSQQQTPHRLEKAERSTPQTALRAPVMGQLQASPSKTSLVSGANRRHSSITTTPFNGIPTTPSSSMAASGAVAGSKRASNGAVLAGHMPFGALSGQRQQSGSSGISLAQLAARESMVGANAAASATPTSAVQGGTRWRA